MPKKPERNNPASQKVTGFPIEENHLLVARRESEKSEAQRRWSIASGIQNRVAGASVVCENTGSSPSSASIPPIDTGYEHGMQKDGIKDFSSRETKESFYNAQLSLKKAINKYQQFHLTEVFSVVLLEHFSPEETSELIAKIASTFQTLLHRHGLIIETWEQQIKTFSSSQIFAVARDLSKAFDSEILKAKLIMSKRYRAAKAAAKAAKKVNK